MFTEFVPCEKLTKFELNTFKITYFLMAHILFASDKGGKSEAKCKISLDVNRE